jgi:hypothetical protein
MITGKFVFKNDLTGISKRILHEGNSPELRSKIEISLSFESSRSAQTRTRCEVVSVGLDKGKAFVHFYSSLFNAHDDRHQRPGYFQEIVDALSLPARVVDLPASDFPNDFVLEHTGGGELKCSPTSLPESFKCELAGISCEELVGKLQTALARLGSGKVFGCEWQLFGSAGEVMNPSIVELVARNRSFPCKSTELLLDIVVPQVSDIERLKCFSTPERASDYLVGYLFVEKKKLAEVGVDVWPDGYVIKFETSGSSSRIEKFIGMPLERGGKLG